MLSVAHSANNAAWMSKKSQEFKLKCKRLSQKENLTPMWNKERFILLNCQTQIKM